MECRSLHRSHSMSLYQVTTSISFLLGKGSRSILMSIIEPICFNILHTAHRTDQIGELVSVSTPLDYLYTVASHDVESFFASVIPQHPTFSLIVFFLHSGRSSLHFRFVTLLYFSSTFSACFYRDYRLLNLYFTGKSIIVKFRNISFYLWTKKKI